MPTTTGFFEEAPGQRSMSRLLAALVAVTAVFVVVVGLFRGGVDGALVAQLLGWVIALKHGGRFLETKGGA